VGFAQPATIEHAPLSRPEPKTPVAMRIAVFFDGTGNNAGNTATGVLVVPSIRLNQRIWIPAASPI